MSFLCSSRKWMVVSSTAPYSLTGTRTSPSWIMPFHIARAAIASPDFQNLFSDFNMLHSLPASESRFWVPTITECKKRSRRRSSSMTPQPTVPVAFVHEKSHLPEKKIHKRPISTTTITIQIRMLMPAAAAAMSLIIFILKLLNYDLLSQSAAATRIIPKIRPARTSVG